MKETDYSHIEKSPELRNRLKSVAKESILPFFPGREPPEEALEYVVVAFCLGESKEEFNDRLKQLFERDCQSVVEQLASFVNSHSEFTKQNSKITPPPKTTSKTQRATQPNSKEDVKTQRKKIVWNRNLDQSTEEDASLNRQPPQEDSSSQLENPQQRRLPRSRLFESALGSIKGQSNHKDSQSSTVKTVKNRVPQMENTEPRRNEKYLNIESRGDPHESIFNRIRKPDGSRFEELESRIMKSTGSHPTPPTPSSSSVIRPPQVSRKRESMDSGLLQDPLTVHGVNQEEVEQLKRKIARLEQEVHGPVSSGRLLLQTQDLDRRSICVKNVHFLANEEVVAAHFHSCAPITNISFAKDPYNRPKGFCFVQFAHETSVDLALELDQSLLLGRTITVVRKLSRAPTSAGRVKSETSKEGLAKQGEGLHRQSDVKDFAIETGSQEIP